MKSSLGVVLPVWNVELHLGRLVQETLEVLSDFAARFELLIIDDASTDQTAEVAAELAREFPQIRVVRHPRRLGLVESARRGVAMVRGDGIYLLVSRPPADAAGLRRTWRELGALRVMGRPAGRQGPLPKRWRTWAAAARQARSARRLSTSRGPRMPAACRQVVRPGEPADGSHAAEGGNPRWTVRPDTAWELNTAALIPLRRSKRWLIRRERGLAR